MSGLFAAFKSKVPTPLSAMLADLDVLGRDTRGSWCDAEAGIEIGRAYRRETSRGHAEPAIVHHGGCVVVVDGRLRAPWPSQGEASSLNDSQIVVEGYQRWGEDCIAHLHGEVAFALWDSARRRLVCAGDVMGRRTLAFHWDGSTFLACTRAVTLLRHPQVPRSINQTYMAHMLCLLDAQAPGTTAFAGIRRLRPGFCVIVDGQGLRERRIDRLRLEPPQHGGHDGRWYEEFWSLLDDSVRDQLGGQRSSCLLLSGGLDSACVASALAQVGNQKVDAYSIVGRNRDAAEERMAMEATLRRYPAIRSHVRPAADAEHAFGELSPELPVLDEPSLVGPAFLSSRLQLWRAVVNDGFSMAIDGEGGDELFMPMGFGDLIQARACTAAMRYLRSHPSARTVLWRAGVVPRLPTPLLHMWRQREHQRRNVIPDWLTPAFRDSNAACAAQSDDEAWLRLRSYAQALPAMIEVPYLVGAHTAARVLSGTCGIRLVSPLFDRRLAEFASRIPCHLRLAPNSTKAFLRYATRDRLPDFVRWRPKTEPIYAELLRETLASAPAQALLALIGNIELLAKWVSVPTVKRSLLGLRRGGMPIVTAAPWQLHALFSVAGWWLRVEGVYGRLST